MAMGERCVRVPLELLLGGSVGPGAVEHRNPRPQPQEPIREARSSRARALYSGPAWVDRDLH